MTISRPLIMTGLFFLLSGCFGGNDDFQDLDQFVSDVRGRPKGQIKSLPQFRPYEVFTYKASTRRSPFDPPEKQAFSQEQLSNSVKPDKNRPKEYLEQFEVDTFSMVGSISNNEGMWGLVRAEDGIHRVKVGDYLGRNSGRIIYINDTEVRLMEIAPAGPDFWIERPRVLRMSE
ncbi:hypothetical protein ACH42_15520 [Endozoicomonas sp. (ex Bugula neritina AB1)]|nr:hypothetical protein ACH42_15520 [Endozoicomonas sp. (ex Bugula neritina AB1)]